MGKTDSSNGAGEPPGAGADVSLRQFGWFAAVLGLAFALPLFEWVRLALRSDLNSHTILIPLVSAYLIWTQRSELPRSFSSSPALAVIPAAFALILLTSGPLARARGLVLTPVDVLAFRVAALWLGLLAGAYFFLGGGFLKRVAFPVFFLGFMVPVPDFLANQIEVFLQVASADASAVLFWVTGTTYFRDEQIFRLPGVVIRVAQECSGVRSSYALFMTSLIAGHLFLRSNWNRSLLAFCVLPLGIVRNAFRIWTLATLASKWDPRVLESALHKHGGPLFFALSLVPFFLLLWWLRRLESRRAERGQGVGGSEAGPGRT